MIRAENNPGRNWSTCGDFGVCEQRLFGQLFKCKPQMKCRWDCEVKMQNKTHNKWTQLKNAFDSIELLVGFHMQIRV